MSGMRVPNPRGDARMNGMRVPIPRGDARMNGMRVPNPRGDARMRELPGEHIVHADPGELRHAERYQETGRTPERRLREP
jgi:hypothetical protein